MLPLDLLREMISLLDDAETYRSFALASTITSKICLEHVEVAKRRFSVEKMNNFSELPSKIRCIYFILPDSSFHGPAIYVQRCSFHTYVDGVEEVS